jgi:hypothetical protein
MNLKNDGCDNVENDWMNSRKRMKAEIKLRSEEKLQ